MVLGNWSFGMNDPEYGTSVSTLYKLFRMFCGDALFAEVRRIDVETLGLKHQLDALRSCAVVLDQKDPHANSLFLAPSQGAPPEILMESYSYADKPVQTVTTKVTITG